MDQTARAAVIMAASARLNARALGMQAQNAIAQRVGNPIPYGQADFVSLIEQEGLGYNMVIRYLAE